MTLVGSAAAAAAAAVADPDMHDPDLLAQAAGLLRRHAVTVAALSRFADGDGPCPVLAEFAHLGRFVGTERHRAAIRTWLRCFTLSHRSIEDLLTYGNPGDVRCAASIARSNWASLMARLTALAAREV